MLQSNKENAWVILTSSNSFNLCSSIYNGSNWCSNPLLCFPDCFQKQTPHIKLILDTITSRLSCCSLISEGSKAGGSWLISESCRSFRVRERLCRSSQNLSPTSSVSSSLLALVLAPSLIFSYKWHRSNNLSFTSVTHVQVFVNEVYLGN